MLKAKKYLKEGLIQLTILLSLIGVRVDLDSYLSGYYSPLIEINLGPSSAYTQTPFHNLRETLDGYSVHPKCPELDHFFASRRLLEEVRTLGSPRFHTSLNAWLVHQVSPTDKTGSGPSSNSSSSSSNIGNGPALQGSEDDREHLPDADQATPEAEHGPCSTGACAFPKEENDVQIKEEEEPAPVTQLAHSSTLEQESLLGGVTSLSDSESHHPPTFDFDQHWNNLLSLSVTDLDGLDSLVEDNDITTAISQDVSLHDAMLTTAGSFGVTSGQGMALGLAALPFASVCNLPGDEPPHNVLSDCLDEAVFDQINQLGLEGLDNMDMQLINHLENVTPQVLEDLDSDSGLSLESSSGGPVSPGVSDMSSSSSSSSSYYEDEGGATGYSSDADALPLKGIADYTSEWSPLDHSESMWHDHSYSSHTFFNQPSVTLLHKGIKEEALSDIEESGLHGQQMSRDELRAQAMYIPFSVLQIVNMPVEEFLEILDGHGFSAEQVTLLRDIRRRGKNKLAAQNCRKRKLDAITGLQEEVERLQAQRNKMMREKQLTAKTMCAVGHQIKQLTRDILARMRDDSGQPLNPERVTLQCGANGRVVVQPLRRPSVSTSSGNKTDKRKKEKKQ
uniref:Nfe2 like bZIP transcription factor 3 n=1 Tax=Cynoglossus semilaevis TaxID=244447 RepID=A0A3P8WD70_CYNSE